MVKPLGLLHPNSGIRICETSLATPAGQFTWQDLIMLKAEIPMKWQAGCSHSITAHVRADDHVGHVD